MLHIGFGFRAFLNPNRSGSASGILRRVRIQYPQLTAAKVSNPKFRGKCRNFLDISKGISQSGMRKIESSEVSQAFSFSEIFLFLMRKARQMPAFLRVNILQRPMFELFGPKNPKSLRSNSIKLPLQRRSSVRSTTQHSKTPAKPGSRPKTRGWRLGP